MSSNRGIFEPQEGFAPAPPAKSPFAVASEDASSSPFAVVPEPESPFAAMKDEHPHRLTPESGRPAKVPERRPEPAATEARSPFSQEPVFGSSPFEAAPASPFSVPEKPIPAPASSPFSFSPEPVQASTAPAMTSAPSSAVSAAIAAAAGNPPPLASAAPAQAAVQPQQQAAAAFAHDGYESDSRSIRQLELRAIFGVDRELTADEILQRSRSLPGIRHVARLAAQDAGVLDGLKRLISGLGFGNGQVKLYSGSIPIEFIREGNVLLAVQTDGGFAPGVRETLMIVARELGRI
ncbi:MAG: hypothetical protein JWO82_324 [Akkermansiaceae bacterium]|nr:hypothetical protein [Akkermansiaceae bacterium]